MVVLNLQVGATIHMGLTLITSTRLRWRAKPVQVVYKRFVRVSSHVVVCQRSSSSSSSSNSSSTVLRPTSRHG
jgi:hypothetical protein